MATGVATAHGDPTVLGAGLRAAVTSVAAIGRTAEGWPVEQRTRLIAEVDTAIAALTAARADLLLAQRASGLWKGAGDPSFEAWRSRTSRSGIRAATTEVRRAETLVAMPGMREAATAGQVSVEHVDAVAKVATGASGPVRGALASEQGQAELLALARRLDAGTFDRSLKRWAAARDAQAHERGHQAQRAARFLHLVDTDTGTRLTGLLDRMAGHRLRLALEAASPRPAADDERTSEQRNADALDTIAERALAMPETTSGAAVRPHVSFVMSAEAWAALRRTMTDHHASQTTPGPGKAQVAEPITLEDGTPVPASEVARALCDCELTRVVMDADSAPLNLGRTQRTYTGVQRRAVIVRDRGCAWPTCGAPARWCEVHHITWWDRDEGETSVEGGVLLCSFHHHEVHRMSLAVARVLAREGVPTAGSGLARVAYVFTAPNGRQVAPQPTDSDRGPESAPARGGAQPPGLGGGQPPGWGDGEPPPWLDGPQPTYASDDGSERTGGLPSGEADRRKSAGADGPSPARANNDEPRHPYEPLTRTRSVDDLVSPAQGSLAL